MTDIDVTISPNDRHRDPLLKGMASAGELFGDMLKEPVDAQGNAIPPPDVSRHPTRGRCRACGRDMDRSYIAFCGGWTPLRECDACAARIPVPAQRLRQYGDRTEARDAA